MKKVSVVILAVMVFASIAAANCGTCAKKPAAPKKCCPATAAKAACPVASSLGSLDLSAEQKTEVDAICKACQEKCKKGTCCKSCQKKIKKVLTKEQSAKFNTLVKSAKKKKK